MVVAMAAVRIITDLITGVIRVPSLWRWAIGLTIATGRAIMLAAPITSGNQDIGHHVTGNESGSMAITSSEEDIDRAAKELRLYSRRGRFGDRQSLNNLNDRGNQAPARQTKTHTRGQAAQSVAHTSTEID